MCIICASGNLDGVYKAVDHLNDYEQAKKAVKKAEASLLELANSRNDRESRKMFGKLHKRFVRLRKSFNEFEHERGIVTSAFVDGRRVARGERDDDDA